MSEPSTPRIANLAQLIETAARTGGAPVEQWDPPYCGDIGLAILADGTWTYRGSAIRREGLVRLFARVLKREADGRHYLVTPAEKVDVAVADAPFLAVEMQVDGEGAKQRLTFRTNVDDVVICGADHPLRFAIESQSGGLKPYVRVRGRLEALLTRSLVFELAELAVPLAEDADTLCVWSSGVRFAMPPDQSTF